MNFIFFILFFCSGFIIVSTENRRISCTLDSMFQCPLNETCKQVNAISVEGSCDCKHNYKRLKESGQCIKEVEDSSTSPSQLDPTLSPNSAPLHHSDSDGSVIPVGVWIIIGCLGVVIVGFGGVVAARRGRWVEHLHRLRLRTYNTVLVSSLNDDDQPIQ